MQTVLHILALLFYFSCMVCKDLPCLCLNCESQDSGKRWAHFQSVCVMKINNKIDDD